MGEQSLGALKGAFQMRAGEDRAYRIMRPGCAALGGLLLIGAAVSFFTAREVGWWIILLIFAAVAFLFPVLSIFDRRRRRRSAVEVYEGGVVVTRGRGQQRALAWADIADVGAKAMRMRHDGRSMKPTNLHDTLGIVHEYWAVQPRGEDAITFQAHDWRDAASMFALIEAGMRADRRPAMRQQLANGERVMFGERYGLSRAGLYKEGQEIAWAHIGGLYQRERAGLQQLLLLRDGEWEHYAYLVSIPLLFLFTELLDELGIHVESEA